ncbi:alpha/beta knot, partial [Rozella allomycis CSF55]
KTDIILIASLLDKPANLGGLCRTCEVFNIKELCVNSEAIKNDSIFKALSMFSDNWQDICQVTRSDLKTFILSKKDAGYTCVGLEQTSVSTPIQDYVFPKKVLVLLGNEKDGIPAEYLSLLDAYLEIPQFGVTRSLNVHVSASILLWEIKKQTLINKSI